MSKFGNAAVLAAEILRGGGKSADAAWRSAASSVFVKAPKSRNKACPREAFLGLCAAGLIRGVSPNTCSDPSDSPNRDYATVAVRLLKANPGLAHGSKVNLWRLVLAELGKNTDKTPNEQVGVVAALWERGLIVDQPGTGQTGAGL